MTPEPPRPARRTRPDSAFRRRALGLDAPPGSPAANPRESFRNALSRIPDIERAEDGLPLVVPVVASPKAPEPTVEPAAEPAAVAPVEPEVILPVESTPGSAPPEALPVAAATEVDLDPKPAVSAPDLAVSLQSLPRLTSPTSAAPPATSPSVPPPPPPADSNHGHRHIAPPPHPPLWRRVGFAMVLILLVVSIPVLGRTGYRLVTSSTDGRTAASGAGPNDPGYEEQVTSTPTALVVQKDAAGLPVGLTFLSLSNGSSGGSVVFVPLDTAVVKPGFGVDRLRTSYGVVADDPTGATKQISFQTAEILNVGIDETIELDDRSWSQVVAPVAPIALDNPEPVELAGGTVPSGQTTLAADQMGPYLAAHRDGEEETAAFYRQQVAWTAWLKAVAASTKADAVPGETGSGIGLFARTLAKGDVTFTNLPGTYSVADDGGTRFKADAGAVNDLMVDTVPAPDAPYEGGRTRARVLNGVGPGSIPDDVLRKVVALNGSVTVVGNGPSFDNDTTTIVYSDAKFKDYAELLQASLGSKGKLKFDRQAPDDVDVTVILGRDVLGNGPQTRSTSATSTTLNASSTTLAQGAPVVDTGSSPGAGFGAATSTAPTGGH